MIVEARTECVALLLIYECSIRKGGVTLFRAKDADRMLVRPHPRTWPAEAELSNKLPQQSTLTANGADAGVDSELKSVVDSGMDPGVESGFDSG